MKHQTTQVQDRGGARPSDETVSLARVGVRQLLEKTESFRALAPEARQQLAGQMVDLVSYLAEPEGLKGNKLPSARASAKPTALKRKKKDAYAFGLADQTSTSSTTGDDKFTAQGAAEGARVAKVYLQSVNFPSFVSSLIEGVFHSIVKSSIEQMQAYADLVNNISKTLNQFRDENVTDNQGRDYLTQQFPDTFQLNVDTGDDGTAQPRVTLKDGADEQSALSKVNSLPIDGGPVGGLDDDTIEGKLVPAARTQLATSRQQLLATMVLMGINRIIVTDGRIQAKVLFDFTAKDNFRFQKSATQFDYGDQYTYTSTGQYGQNSGDSSSQDDSQAGAGASYYTSGQYQNTSTPVVKLVSASQSASAADLTTKATLSGLVEVNFKSETFPLEKMADSFQIGQIQNAAKPGQGKAAAVGAGSASSGSTAPAPASTPAPATPQPAAAHP
jgi:hypothetical protein